MNTTNPTPLRPLLVISALASLVTIVVAVFGMVSTAQAPWLAFAFQATIILAGALGVLQGLRRFDGAPAMASLCVAGTFFVAGFLAYYGAGGQIAFRSLVSGHPDSFDAGTLPTWALLAEIGASVIVGAVAGLLALGRSPGESWKQLVIGVALGAPVVVGGAAAYKLHLAQRIGSLHMIVATLVSVSLFVLVVGLLSASANAIIGAFAAGLPDLDDPSVDPEAPVHAKPKANKAGSSTGAGSSGG
jgi:hypothetical protein